MCEFEPGELLSVEELLEELKRLELPREQRRVIAADARWFRARAIAGGCAADLVVFDVQRCPVCRNVRVFGGAARAAADGVLH